MDFTAPHPNPSAAGHYPVTRNSVKSTTQREFPFIVNVNTRDTREPRAHFASGNRRIKAPPPRGTIKLIKHAALPKALADWPGKQSPPRGCEGRNCPESAGSRFLIFVPRNPGAIFAGQKSRRRPNKPPNPAAVRHSSREIRLARRFTGRRSLSPS